MSQSNQTNQGNTESPTPTRSSRAANNRRKKKKRSAGMTALIVIIWIAVIIFAIWLTLFISSKIANFDTISDMLQFIKEEALTLAS